MAYVKTQILVPFVIALMTGLVTIAVKRIFVKMDHVEHFSFVSTKRIHTAVNIIPVKVFRVKIMGYVLNMELNISVSVRQDGKENFAKK